MTVKQVIVMRTDLNMRKGKMVAQGAHASMAAVLPTLQRFSVEKYFELLPEQPLTQWLEGQFTKVCLQIDSEAELLALYEKANAKSMHCALITDSGKTEFNGVPTNTCIAIGPDFAEAIDEITGHLKLL